LIWWIAQAVRAQAERAGIGELAERASWLSNISWRLAPDLQLAADFDLKIGEKHIPLTLLYPAFFPDGAPSIISRDGVRLSGHQYGAKGELCLEHRPDNWSSDVTGAMMIESAYRLLSIESDTGEPAPSAHRTTAAQDLRGAILRFLLTREASAALATINHGQAVEAEVVEHSFAGCCATQLSRIGPATSPSWTEPNPRGGGGRSYRGWALQLAGEPDSKGGLDELVSLLESHAFHDVAKELRETSEWKFLILVDGEIIRSVCIWGSPGAMQTVGYSVMQVEEPRPRVDPEYALLEGRKVAVVGCGSVGSKVAVHLARSGCRKFVLVDGDIFESGNLVRNELDWRAVGLHKAPALAARLKEIRAGCEVTIHTTLLGGQEPGSSLASAMGSIESCDLIIEATADATVFNLCASISRRSRKPMCWAQVFGGGVGGFVARVRPDLDPTPLAARRLLDAYYASQDVPLPEAGPVGPYEASGDGPPLIADDADVSVVAAHLARMAVDLAARPEATIFPCSAYVIGLRQGWIFSAPFDTHPVDLGDSDEWGTKQEGGSAEALQQLLADLAPKEVSDAS
jgi:molybdopterin/thiamine biosynthesis adenylyltransferase